MSTSFYLPCYSMFIWCAIPGWPLFLLFKSWVPEYKSPSICYNIKLKTYTMCVFLCRKADLSDVLQVCFPDRCMPGSDCITVIIYLASTFNK